MMGSTPTGWVRKPLGEVIELKRGYDLPSRARTPGSYPIVSSSGTTDWHVEPKVRGPGVVAGRYGTIGEVFYVASDFWPLNTTLYVRDFKGSHPQFISYLLRTINWHRYVDKAAVPGVNRNHVHLEPVVVPGRLEQEQIASILGALDDKIEVNRRMNETLEGMARALFKSWFVDFDPVRAKMEGRAPHGMDADTAALFPDSFHDSELGPIPKGWDVVPLRSTCSLDKGVSYKGTFLSETGKPMVNLGCFKGDGGFDYAKLKGYAGEYRPRHVARAGDLLIANTDMTQNRVILGSPVLLEGAGEVLFSHHVYALRFGTPDPEFALFLFYSLLQPTFRERAQGFATGTTVLALPRDSVLEMSVIRPPKGLLLEFSRLVSPIRERKSLANRESRALANLRDTLLPKLLSGELRVPEAEEIAKSA